MLGSAFEQFEVHGIGVSNSGVWAMGVSLIWCGILVLSGVRVVGSRWQKMREKIEGVIGDIVSENIGEGKWVRIMTTIGVFITGCNVAGIVPYGYTVTGQLAITGWIAGGVWLGKLKLGVRRHGRRMWGMFMPSGAPLGMIGFFVVIEIVGFVIPLGSLAVRLFANMMSGHVLMKVIYGFVCQLGSGVLGSAISLLSVLLLCMLMGLEAGVSVIQGYVFVLLSSIYVKEAIAGGH